MPECSRGRRVCAAAAAAVTLSAHIARAVNGELSLVPYAEDTAIRVWLSDAATFRCCMLVLVLIDLYVID